MSEKKPAAPRKRAPRKKKVVEQTAAVATDTLPADARSQASVEPVQAALIRVPMPVRWRDLDAFNHVNNSQFLSYLEEARLRWMVTIPGDWMDENVAPVVAAAHVNYRRPIEWPNEIAVELFVERLGNSSLTIGHRIVAAEGDALYADGNVVMVWIDKQGGQAAVLPAAVRAACEH